MELRKIRFIRNPKSGIVRTQNLIRKTIEWSFRDYDYEFIETRYPGHAHELAAEAAALGYDAVVAIGGDGTTNEIGSALLHKDTALGVIPLGSGNGLARGLKIPLSPLRAIKLLKTGRIVTIDAGRVEDNVFFIGTGMGFDAAIGKAFNERHVRGLLPYFTVGIREYFSYKPEVYVLKFDGKQIAASALFVTIANLKGWGGGAIISPNAQYDDGLLDVCILHKAPTWYIVVNLYKLFTGGVVKLRRYSRFQTSALEILRERPGPYHFDGEVREGGTELHVSMIPKALKVIVPDEKNETNRHLEKSIRRLFTAE
ncbi:MAG: YegS/Rv2252/BmrU family lipid kinase [candidate division KSB1 bacterium]|nr:YegS/Rv2252/BmrU family lipid kinase [candidate division KSB1 bacterium]